MALAVVILWPLRTEHLEPPAQHRREAIRSTPSPLWEPGDEPRTSASDLARAVQEPEVAPVVTSRPRRFYYPTHLHGHLLDLCEEPLVEDPWIPSGFVENELAGLRVAYDERKTTPAAAMVLAEAARDGLAFAAAVTDTEERRDVTLVVYPEIHQLRSEYHLPEWVNGLYDGAIRAGADSPLPELRRVMRHEAMHAQLHAAVGCVPAWLNEGLAKYAQVRAGDVVRRLVQQIRERSAVPFQRLGGPTIVDTEDTEVAGTYYAQSLAMVLWLERDVGIPEAIDRATAVRPQPEEYWPMLMPGRTEADYLQFLRDHIEAPSDGSSCVLRLDDVDAIRCLTEAELAELGLSASELGR
ncbi:MAG: hypothetical protein AAGF12_25825 [Myxococcota bacterium]